VKGLYNSLTLATYGYTVENVPIKPSPVPVPVKIEPLLNFDDHLSEDYSRDEPDKELPEIKIKSLDSLRGKLYLMFKPL
jgi:hypothetical protein